MLKEANHRNPHTCSYIPFTKTSKQEKLNNIFRYAFVVSKTIKKIREIIIPKFKLYLVGEGEETKRDVNMGDALR
jgi:hypothetical protein